MPSLRLLADDLTGALDTAAEFIGLCGPVEVRWANRLPAIIPQSLAIDSGTREYPRTKAAEIVHGLAPLLHNGTIAYKKVDSLMRGAWPGELAACFRLGFWRHCVMAPCSRTRSAEPRAAGNSREAEMVRGAPPAPTSRQNCAPKVWSP